jgi:N-methylhydantoinase B
VVLDDNGAVDESATEDLRTQLRADRPAELPVFNMGPPLEEILANALEETGLPAPRQPVPR